MSGNHILHFGTGTGKAKKYSRCLGWEHEELKIFPSVWDGNGIHRNHSRSLGLERENSNILGTGTAKFKVLQSKKKSFKMLLSSQTECFCN